MRTLSDDFAVKADDSKRNINLSYNTSNNNASFNNGNTIPYHARENSLPFSYGQIGKTSTPLKSYRSAYANNDIDSAYISVSDYRDVNDNYKKTGNEYNTDASMIKSQPRLKSPLLVRKTLNGNPPTSVEANSSAKAVFSSHYNNSNNIYGSDRHSPTFAGKDYINNHFYGSTSHQRVPTRNEFENLLRERREKVYNEYREQSTVVPPPRQFRGSDVTDAVYATPHHRKYIDFDFHLNLDDEWLQSPTIEKVPPQPPVRASSNTFGRREELQRELYRTRDIEFPPLKMRDVHRNYYTLSNNSASTYTKNANTLDNRDLEQTPYGNSIATERFFETYEQRRQQTQSLPQPQRQQMLPQTIQQQQRAEYTTTSAYGNENAAGYSYNQSNGDNYHNNLNKNSMIESNVVYRSSLDPSTSTVEAPIYATTTKHVAKFNNQPSKIVTDYQLTRTMNSPSTPLFSRPETPAFPVTPRTPFGTMPNGYSHNERRLDHSLSNNGHQYTSESIYQLTSPRPRLNSSFSVATTNAEPQEVAPHLVKFAKDSSKFWYKPNMSRDDAISLLINAPPGTFVVRDSTTYKNAYGLVLRVAQAPPNANATGKPDELVRHFLIEPTTRGVRLKGCANEPVFTSLSALVYEHSINQLALPCLLRIPEEDLMPPLVEPTPAQKQLLTQGAACNVLWLYSCDTESLTGEEAIRKAIRQLYAQKPLPAPTEVHFKVSVQGITLTDNTKITDNTKFKKFFRKHYASDTISFCAIDPDHRTWNIEDAATQESNKSPKSSVSKKTIFAFVARRSPSSKDNQCHVFCDLQTNQPASAIVTFANKILPTERQRNYVL